MIDAAIAVVAFAASLGLLAAGDADLANADGDVGALEVLLTALASLPLVARRRAPLAIFLLTAVASIALRGVAAPAGPPIGPTVALFGLALAGDGSRARQRLTLSIVAVTLAAHVAASGFAARHRPSGLLRRQRRP